jgi:hypothetical protein
MLIGKLPRMRLHGRHLQSLSMQAAFAHFLCSSLPLLWQGWGGTWLITPREPYASLPSDLNLHLVKDSVSLGAESSVGFSLLAAAWVCSFTSSCFPSTFGALIRDYRLRPLQLSNLPKPDFPGTTNRIQVGADAVRTKLAACGASVSSSLDDAKLAAG